MSEKKITSWSEFTATVAEVRQEYGYHELELGEGNVYKQKNVVLFRGQNNALWPIQTTLERTTTKRLDVSQYMLHATNCSNELESFSGRSWKIPSYPEFRKEIQGLRGCSGLICQRMTIWFTFGITVFLHRFLIGLNRRSSRRFSRSGISPSPKMLLCLHTLTAPGAFEVAG